MNINPDILGYLSMIILDARHIVKIIALLKYKTVENSNISSGMTSFIGNCVYTMYGVSLDQFPMILSGSLGVLLDLITLLLSQYYIRKGTAIQAVQ